MEEQAKQNQEKMFKVTVVFNRMSSSVFGGVAPQEVSMLLPESTKNRLLKAFFAKEGVFSVTMSDNSIRHINVANILYIDEQEMAVADGGKNG